MTRDDAGRRCAALFGALVLVAACGSRGGETAGTDVTTTTVVPTTTTTTTPTVTTIAASAIAVRHLDLVDEDRGRALPTTVWYPAPVSGEDIPAATGPFPVVLFSHGLRGLPEDYESLIYGWVQDGFVVVAPTYPNTNRGATSVDAGDLTNQPADATFVLDAVLGLSTTSGDLLEGALDTERVAAVGHSEGGITTVGLFDACCRDPRLRAAIVLSGNGLGSREPYSGTAAKVLYVHGDTDPLVPIALGRATFERNPWPKAFITLTGAGHLDPYLEPIAAQFALVHRATSDFLAWALLDDQKALDDLREAVAEPASAATIDDQLG